MDLNENEDGPVASLEGKPGARTLKERGLTLLTGVGGGRVDLNVRNASRDPEIMLVAAEDGFLSGPVVSGDDGDDGDPQDCSGTSPPHDRLSCPNCYPGANMSNGVTDSPQRGVEVLSARFLGNRLGQCDADWEEGNVANGGLHTVRTGSDPSIAEPSLPSHCVAVRPQSLRTNPGASVSLSCDATPLSPDEDGGFYLDPEAGVLVLEAGRRQSAPDKLSQESQCSELKVLPKRFGIADFFTR